MAHAIGSGAIRSRRNGENPMSNRNQLAKENSMIIDLTGRKAIVTGSTAGIGRAAAEGLTRAGAAVVVNGRTETRVEEAARQIRQAAPHADIAGFAADMATADADILVNNVGTAHIREYHGVDDIAAIPDEDWLGLFQLNVMSGVRATRHYLSRMVGRGWGRVVFVSSESAVNIPQEMLDYGIPRPHSSRCRAGSRRPWREPA
jgi:NAD(P)-dependent dehydrogenase (short-subunit alcohol dehydrogenase family)